MFLGKLEEFQRIHEENLLEKCQENQDMVLSAPTGSGKTVLVCKFIEDYLDENPNTVILWLCPGAGSLQKQSQESFEDFVSETESGDIYSFIGETDPRGKVYFINWDKINKSSNTVLREGEHKNLMERVADCHRNNIDIFMMIDEEHKYQETANYFVDEMVPKHVLRISATPATQNSYTEVITDDEVISAGLIASNISINEGVSKAVEENNNLDDDLLLIALADKKRKEVIAEYEKLGINNIRPLVLIQFRNGSDEWIARIKAELENLGYTKNSGLVASWFSGDHPDNVEEIKKLNGQYAFLLFKQAIATGWDCPRAKILVKLREGGTEAFNIQTIGRIRRMPERKHYDNDILDKCYVYTLDNQFKEGLTNAVSESFYSYLYKSKFNIDMPLYKESLDGSDRFAVNPEAVVKVIRNRFLSDCDIDRDGIITRTDLIRAKGYIFGTVLKTSSFEGVARTTKDILKLNNIFCGEHEINTHDDGFIIRDAKRRIARAIGIDENISNNALRILFGPEDKQFSLFTQEEMQFEEENKIIKDMNLREYNAFLVNNKDRLIETFSGVSAQEIAEIEETAILTSNWQVPSEQYYKQHKKIESTKIMSKNAFANYGNNILLDKNRSHTEIVFEYWCEQADSVEQLYKNGDKGSEFFSIVYRTAFHRANFYPDYIIKQKNGDVWIIEAKGGVDSSDCSKNIDQYAKNKFEALKDYANRYGDVKWGFVRAIGQQLYMSNTEWTDDMSNRKIWKPIECFID